MNPELSALVQRQTTTMQIICAALTASLGFYVGIAWLLQRQGSFTMGPVPEDLPLILSLTGFSLLIVAEIVFRGLAARARRVEPPEGRLIPYQSAVVVGFALRESAGVLGLVLTLLTGDLRWVVGLSLLAGVAMVAAWPRRSTLEELVQAIPPIG
ncbi:MAG: hypothetical protein K8R59_06030 [Thermoanaerobaculales bacterium]|nr:hypothetical protein [Thermoanaerobaculales bacterium]